MNGKAITFAKVHVERMSGVGRGEGFVIKDLSRGINIIHGPNGSGKSTTVRVIHELLWPGRTGTEHAMVGGTYSLNGSAWQVDVDAGSAAQSSGMRPTLRLQEWTALVVNLPGLPSINPGPKCFWSR